MNELESNDLKDVKIVSLRDVHYSISQLQSLVRELPKTAEYTLDKLYEIKTGVPYVLEDEIDSIINRIELSKTIEQTETTETPPCPLIEQKYYEGDFNDLRIRLETYIKWTGFQEIWDKINERFSRIDNVWPPSSFDFRTVRNDMDKDILPANIIENIDSSIKAFNDGRFSESINNCGHCTKAIVNRFCSLLEINCNGLSFYNQINEIKKSLESKSVPPAGLHWYILFLISVGYWLRNAEAHKEESETRIPPWMDDHRKKQINRVENARVMLVCTLQAAKELQFCMTNERL